LPSQSPTEDELKQMIVRMREKGLRATGCNSAIRSINAYLKWAGSPLKIPQMKEPQIILPTYSATQLQLLAGLEATEGDRASAFDSHRSPR
jgi:integrase/recombinase XerD